MASKETERMIKLGEWLEQFLAKDIPLNQLEKIFITGLNLYGFPQTKKIDTFSSAIFEIVGEDKRVTITDFKKTFFPKMEEWQTFIGDVKVHREKFSDYKHIEMWHPIRQLLYYHNELFKILKDVSRHDLPWQQTFIKIENKDMNPYIFTILREDYAYLVDCFDDTFQKTKALLESSSRREYPRVSYEWRHTDSLPIIVARIFLDFLLLGGQDHIHFCKQCGRFTVIKRKGRKEYCSSLCRVRASNERIAQADD